MSKKNIQEKFNKRIESINLLFRRKRIWNTKTISLVAILIATSIAFVAIARAIAPPIAIWPSLRIGIAGLPIKITGFIFGPFIGGLTGVLSSILAGVLVPTGNIHWSYTLAYFVAGFVPGVVGYIYNRRWRVKGNVKDNIKSINAPNMYATMITILLIMAFLTYFILGANVLNFSKAIVKNKYAFFGIVISGSGSMFIFILISRFIFSPKTFNIMLPIITFSVLLDLINTPLVSYGDWETINSGKGPFVDYWTPHTLWTPFKSWGNLFIIFFAYKIVSPLIFAKTSNSWDDLGDSNDDEEIVKNKKVKDKEDSKKQKRKK